MTDQVVSLTIDGHEAMCPTGSTIYEAAEAVGVHIPTFCHHEKLVPVGACRMCLVEIEGIRGLQTSCTTPARDGMVVRVHTSPAAVKARKANIEFLLTNHPLDCPVCDKGGECPLQDQAMLDGPGESRYVEEKRHKNKRYPLGDMIVLDQERCVLCWRCVRFLDEWADDHELDLFGRGANTRIDTFANHPLRSKWQGNTIDICPVGALTSRVFRFESRVWELTNTPTICPLCSIGCNIVLGVKNNRLRRITPRENMQVNDAWICDRGRFIHGYVDHPDRLKTPLIRRNGELQAASWDEALDLVAGRFNKILGEGEPQAIAGLGSTRLTNEANYLFQRFMRTVVGCNNVDHLGRMPDRVTPLRSLPELEDNDAILLLGCDPSTEAPLLELWIKKAAIRHGAKVLVANPRRPELGRYQGPWLGYRPGTEQVLMHGLARAILDAGLVETEDQGSRAPNTSEYQMWLKDWTPTQVKRVTGVAPEALQLAAHILAQAKHPIILYGPAWIRGSTATLEAMTNVALLLGDIESGFVAEDNNTLGAREMGVVPDLYPGGQSFQDNRIRNRLAGFWGGRLSPVEGLNFDGMMETARAGGLEAMWIVGSDPANECRLAGEALGRIPFLVVQDLFMTDTSSLAEVILPAASFAETDGSYANLTGRLQVLRAGMRPPGEAQPDWWIIAELAKRMLDDKRRRAWEFGGPAQVLGEIARAVPNFRLVDYARMGEKGFQRPAPETRARRAFTWVEPEVAAHNPEFPLILATGRLLYDRGTLMSRSARIRNLVPAAFVMINPVDARELELADGDSVSVVSPKGRLAFTLHVSDEVAPGVAFAPRNLSDAPLSVLFADRWTLPRVRIVK
jgi:NADH-quinone oxidoreductase chain G